MPINSSAHVAAVSSCIAAADVQRPQRQRYKRRAIIEVFCAACIVTLAPRVASADRDRGFEARLAPIDVQGAGMSLPGPSYVRPQLVDPPSRAPKILGATLSIAGGVSLVAGWVMYVTRQNHRLEMRYAVDTEVLDGWEQRGAWGFWLAAGASTMFVASEYLQLPEASDVPTWAWLGGAAGLATAAVGLGFAAGGTHCAPIALRPGTAIPRECLSGTSDALFGQMLLLTAAPVLNLPLTYLLRSVFHSEQESLTMGPGGVSLKMRF